MIGPAIDPVYPVTLSQSLRQLILTWAFALSAVLLGHGLIMHNQATAFFGALFLGIAFVLIIVDAGYIAPRYDEPDVDTDPMWER